MTKLTLCLLLLFACKPGKYELYLDTSSSDGSKSGYYLHDGEKIADNKYRFIFHDQRTGVVDTTIVRIINK